MRKQDVIGFFDARAADWDAELFARYLIVTANISDDAMYQVTRRKP